MEKKKQKKETDLNLDEKGKFFWDVVDRYFVNRLIEFADNAGKGEEKVVSYIKSIYKDRPLGKPLSDKDQAKLNTGLLTPDQKMKLSEIVRSFNIPIPLKVMSEIVIILMPYPLENKLVPEKRSRFSAELDRYKESILDEANKKIKLLSGMIGQIKGMSVDALIDINQPLGEAVCYLDECKAYLQEIVGVHAERKRDLLVDDNLQKEPHKHRFWNTLIVKAVGMVNPYCHDTGCNDCKKTHDKAILIVHALLKILHPGIWKDTSLDSIKTRYFSHN